MNIKTEKPPASAEMQEAVLSCDACRSTFDGTTKSREPTTVLFDGTVSIWTCTVCGSLELLYVSSGFRLGEHMAEARRLIRTPVGADDIVRRVLLLCAERLAVADIQKQYLQRW